MLTLDLATPGVFAIVALIACFAGLIRGFTGFGGPAVMILLLVPFFSPLSVLPKAAIIDALANIRLLPTTWREVNWRVAVPLIAASLVAVPLGYFALYHIQPEVMKRVIAVLVAVCTVLMMTGWRLSRMPSITVIVIAGFIAGVVLGATLIAFVAAVFLLSLPVSAAQTRATLVLWGFVLTFVFLVAHLQAGNVALTDALLSGLIGFFYLLAVELGSRFFRRSGEAVFRRFVLLFLLVLAAVGLLV